MFFHGRATSSTCFIAPPPVLHLASFDASIHLLRLPERRANLALISPTDGRAKKLKLAELAARRRTPAVVGLSFSSRASVAGRTRRSEVAMRMAVLGAVCPNRRICVCFRTDGNPTWRWHDGWTDAWTDARSTVPNEGQHGGAALVWRWHTTAETRRAKRQKLKTPRYGRSASAPQRSEERLTEQKERKQGSRNSPLMNCICM